jgi:hypothetical protein
VFLVLGREFNRYIHRILTIWQDGNTAALAEYRRVNEDAMTRSCGACPWEMLQWERLWKMLRPWCRMTMREVIENIDRGERILGLEDDEDDHGESDEDDGAAPLTPAPLP